MSKQKCGFTLKNIVLGEMLAFHEVSRNNCLCSFSVLRAWPHSMVVSCSLSLKLACSYIIFILYVLGSFSLFCVQRIIFYFACPRCCANCFGMINLWLFPVCSMCANCRTLSAVRSILNSRLFFYFPYRNKVVVLF